MKQIQWGKIGCLFIMVLLLLIMSTGILGNQIHNHSHWQQPVMPNIAEDSENIGIEQNAKKMEKVISFKDSYKLSNTVSYYQYFYYTDKMQNLTAGLNLSMLFSETAIPETSSITVYVNEVPVSSHTFAEIKQDGQAFLALDNSYFRQGFNNAIAIKAFIKSSTNECELNEEMNWALVKKGSSLTLTYYQKPIQYVSELYEGTYHLEYEGANLCVAIPEHPTEFDYTMLATYSAMVGSYFKSTDAAMTIETVPYGKLKGFDHSAVVLGTSQAIAEAFPDISWPGQKEPKDGLFIGIHELDGINHMFIMAESEADLYQLTGLFEQKDIYGQLAAKEYRLPERPAIPPKDMAFQNEIQGYIRDIGYENAVVVGSGQQMFQYYLGLPGKYSKARESRLRFYYSYSEFLDFEDSYVTVYVNNTPVQTHPLRYDKAAGDSIEFTIPEELYDYNGFNVVLDFNLINNRQCKAKVSDGSWVKVDNQKSSFYFKLEQRSRFSLSNSTSLVQDAAGRINGTILAAELGNDLRSFANFCSYLGKRSFGVSFLGVDLAETVPADFEGLVLGPSSSPLLYTLSNQLEIPFTVDGNVAENPLFRQINSNIGIIQLSKDRKIVTLSGDCTEQLNYAMDYYREKVNRYDAQIITRNDGLLAKFTDEPGKGSVLAEQQRALDVIGQLRENWVLLLFVFLLSGMLLLFSWQIRIKKNRLGEPNSNSFGRQD